MTVQLNGIIPGKRYLTVFKPTKDLPLNLRQLSVFSYYLFQDRYNTVPPYSVAATATGYDPETVSACCEHLRKFQFMDAGNKSTLTPERLNEFYLLKTGKDKHPSKRICWWRFYVRNPEGPLTATAVSVWSFLWHVAHNPAPGKPTDWSLAYIASCLHIKPETVVKSLEMLQKHGFLTWSKTPFVLKLTKPGPEQLAMLDNSPATSRTIGQLILADDSNDTTEKAQTVLVPQTDPLYEIGAGDVTEELQQIGIPHDEIVRYLRHCFDSRNPPTVPRSQRITFIIQGYRTWTQTTEYKEWQQRLAARQSPSLTESFGSNGSPQ
jgi:hypothetical protein